MICMRIGIELTVNIPSRRAMKFGLTFSHIFQINPFILVFDLCPPSSKITPVAGHGLNPIKHIVTAPPSAPTFLTGTSREAARLWVVLFRGEAAH